MSDRHISQPAASTEEDIEDLNEQLRRRFKREREVTQQQIMHQQPFNGSTKFISAMLTLLSMLVAAAICGEVVVYGQVQTLQAQVQMIIGGHIK